MSDRYHGLGYFGWCKFKKHFNEVYCDKNRNFPTAYKIISMTKGEAGLKYIRVTYTSKRGHFHWMDVHHIDEYPIEKFVWDCLEDF